MYTSIWLSISLLGDLWCLDFTQGAGFCDLELQCSQFHDQAQTVFSLVQLLNTTEVWSRTSQKMNHTEDFDWTTIFYTYKKVKIDALSWFSLHYTSFCTFISIKENKQTKTDTYTQNHWVCCLVWKTLFQNILPHCCGTIKWRSSLESLACRFILCRLWSIVAQGDHFVRCLSVRVCVCASVCLSGSHTFLVMTLSYVWQATHAFLWMLSFWSFVYICLFAT